MNSKLKIFLIASVVLSAVFALLNISFQLDISFFAFPLCAVFTAVLYIFAQKLLRFNVSNLTVLRKLLQYYPFVLLAAFILRRAGLNETSLWFDALSVTLWIIASVSSLVVLYFIDAKRIFKLNKDLETAFNKMPKIKRTPLKRFVFEFFDWIDAFVQAAFTVVLLNIFVIQLYAIPSESMVSEFLIGDRVAAFKTASGPAFPLSKISLPQLRTYNRGDIVIFRNPHYDSDRKSEIKTFVSQLVYMLTFTAVNLNTDEYGRLKADPLVKRVVGIPGEQLVMVDGILYSRTAQNNAFVKVTQDETWAHWNLNTLPAAIKEQVRDIPLSQNDYNAMIAVEKERAELTFMQAEKQAREIVRQFAQIWAKLGKKPAFTPNTQLTQFLTQKEMLVYTLFAANDDLTRRLLTADLGLTWFTAFMTDWTTHPQNLDMYQESMYRLNLLIKLEVGKLILRNAELIANGISAVDQIRDKERMQILTRARDLNLYVLLNDSRNMPVFPAQKNGEAQYIPQKNYFMMGDNRFNSLDMRHSYESRLVPLSPQDTYSVTYETKLAPQYIASNRILGTAVLRFWPPNRFSFF